MTQAASTTLESFSTDLATLVARASGSVVGVNGHRSRASGFAWRPGLVVTCEEALADEGPYELVLPGGTRVGATLVGRDPTTDVAVLRHEGGDLPISTVVTSAPAAGSLVTAVGSFDGAPNACLGIVSHVSGPWRAMRGGEIDARINLDLRLGKNAEGGLALDVYGNAFGMVVFGPRRRALVIPAATIERVADSLVKNGRIAHGYLGLGLWPTRVDGEDTTGNIVISVDPNGPGAAAGLHQGDVLVRWNDQPMRPIRQLMRELGPASVGTIVSLGFRRAGKTQSVALKIGERPDA